MNRTELLFLFTALTLISIITEGTSISGKYTIKYSNSASLSVLPSFLSNFLSTLILVDKYSITKNKWCYTNGNSNQFSSLDAAKASCSSNGKCVGLYDICGNGTVFHLCNEPINAETSDCGSILYQRIGK